MKKKKGNRRRKKSVQLRRRGLTLLFSATAAACALASNCAQKLLKQRQVRTETKNAGKSKGEKKNLVMGRET